MADQQTIFVVLSQTDGDAPEVVYVGPDERHAMWLMEDLSTKLEYSFELGLWVETWAVGPRPSESRCIDAVEMMFDQDDWDDAQGGSMTVEGSLDEPEDLNVPPPSWGWAEAWDGREGDDDEGTMEQVDIPTQEEK